jgi:LysR family transcriptional regulator, cys regulon transcriptional activator
VTLQQLRYLYQIAQAGLNVSDAAEALHTSQPGISKQVRLLEEELGVTVFVRNGKRIVGITEAGRTILAIAQRILKEADNLKSAGRELRSPDRGSLTIATTHTQARYVLPPVIRKFIERYPAVRLTLHQGNPTQVAEAVVAGEADLAIATEGIESFSDLVTLPCYQWNRCIVTPPGHPLQLEAPLTLEALAEYPLITYDFSFTGRAKINQAFETLGLKPNVVLSALDSDVIKTYVELGLGVGILANMAFDPARDKNLVRVDASHLFEPSTTRIGIRRGNFLRAFHYEFIHLFAPQLSRGIVDEAMTGKGADYII